jgi:hypothetical protein
MSAVIGWNDLEAAVRACSELNQMRGGTFDIYDIRMPFVLPSGGVAEAYCDRITNQIMIEFTDDEVL